MAEVGRPRKYETVKELENKINEYFVSCERSTWANGNNTVTKPYTISGLCLHLDITRETLCNYEEIPEFFDTIKKAKMKIENCVEEMSLMGLLNPTVSIFNLKNNFGWKDKTEVDNNNFNAEVSYEELLSKIESK